MTDDIVQITVAFLIDKRDRCAEIFWENFYDVNFVFVEFIDEFPFVNMKKVQRSFLKRREVKGVLVFNVKMIFFTSVAKIKNSFVKLKQRIRPSELSGSGNIIE
jgi:hypothetical protein